MLTSPAPRKTLRCREMPGCGRVGKAATSSPAGRSPSFSRSSIRRRVGFEIAVKTSLFRASTVCDTAYDQDADAGGWLIENRFPSGSAKVAEIPQAYSSG